VKRTSAISHAFLLGVLALSACAFSAAQISSVDTSKPIVVRNPHPPKVKRGQFFGQVLSSTPKSITVRSDANLMAVRTFTYAGNLSASSFAYGQSVEIDYTLGSDVALRIKTAKPR
jgi:hypothetical protein